MEKKELKEEIKKVLEGKSIYEMSPISGLNPMTKEEIIYWIVETYIDQELDKAREEGKGRKLQGWECPKCGSVYSPLTFECPTCKNSGIKVRTSDRTSGYDNTSYLN